MKNMNCATNLKVHFAKSKTRISKRLHNTTTKNIKNKKFTPK
jgi:hypothetical protein